MSKVKDLFKKGKMTKLLIIAAISGLATASILTVLGNWLESEFGFDSFVEIVSIICIIFIIVLGIVLIIVNVAMPGSSKK